MLSILIASVVGLLFGIAIGVASVVGLQRHRRARRDGMVPVVAVSALDETINRAAAEWAAAHGRPEAAGLVAEKLRLVDALSRSRRAKTSSSRRRWRR